MFLRKRIGVGRSLPALNLPALLGDMGPMLLKTNIEVKYIFEKNQRIGCPIPFRCL